MSNSRFAINEKSGDRFKVNMLYITHSMYEGDWNSKLHSHYYTEIFYVIRGNGKFHVENEVFDIGEDDLIIVNPFVSHTEMGIPDHDLEYIVLGIENLEFLNNTDKGDYNYTRLNYYEYKHEVLFYLKTLLIEAQNKDEGYELVCRNLLEVLIINMIRRAKVALKPKKSTSANKDCEFIEKYIDTHFKDNIDLNTLSKVSYMNKYHLVHSFTKFKGISPMQYLQKKRIEEAKTLLATTDLTMSEIGNVLGFSSSSYFAQAFKKNMKRSPAQYRKECNRE